MKRSDMILNIASELVHEHINFISFDKAQELAEVILSRIEIDLSFIEDFWEDTIPEEWIKMCEDQEQHLKDIMKSNK